MRYGRVFYRFLAVLLSAQLALPAPSLALRTMSVEGAGLEELQRELIPDAAVTPTAGMEEKIGPNEGLKWSLDSRKPGEDERILWHSARPGEPVEMQFLGGQDKQARVRFNLPPSVILLMEGTREMDNFERLGGSGADAAMAYLRALPYATGRRLLTRTLDWEKSDPVSGKAETPRPGVAVHVVDLDRGERIAWIALRYPPQDGGRRAEFRFVAPSEVKIYSRAMYEEERALLAEMAAGLGAHGFTPETGFEVLERALKTRAESGEEYKLRLRAVSALAERPEREARGLLLSRLDIREEPARHIRLAAIAGLGHRIQSGGVSEAEREEILGAWVSLLLGSKDGAADPDEWVRKSSAVCLAVFTPDAQMGLAGGVLEQVGSRPDPSENVREAAGRMLDLLARRKEEASGDLSQERAPSGPPDLDLYARMEEKQPEKAPQEIPAQLRRLYTRAYEAQGILVDNLGRMARGDAPPVWEKFEAILEEAHVIAGEKRRSALDDETRDVLDALFVTEMHSVMVRATDPKRKVGEEMSGETAQRLETMLAMGNRLLEPEEGPPPNFDNAVTIRFLQAEVVRDLWASGKFPDAGTARLMLTHPHIPLAERCRLLQDFEIHQSMKLQKEIDALEGRTGVTEQEMLGRVGRLADHRYRAMAYGLLRVVTYSRNESATEQDLLASADALALFLPHGLAVGEVFEHVQEARRLAIRNAIAMYLRDAQDRPGEIPDDMIQAALDGDEAALTELAMLACGILALASAAETSDQFAAEVHGLERDLRELHWDYLETSAHRARLLSPIPAGGPAEGVAPYGTAIVEAPPSSVQTLLTFEDVEMGAPAGQYVQVPQEGVLIPFGHFAMEARGGFRVIDEGALVPAFKKGERRMADWFVALRGRPSLTLLNPVWDFFQSDPRRTKGPEGLLSLPDGVVTDGFTAQVVPDHGILILPHAGRPIWLERIPGELRPGSPEERGLLGLLIEGLRLKREELEREIGREFLLTALQEEMTYVRDQRFGFEIRRGPGRMVRVREMGPFVVRSTIPLGLGKMPPDGYLLEGPGGQAHRLSEGDHGLEATPAPGEELDGTRRFFLTASVSGVLEPRRWSQKKLEQRVGPLKPGEMREIPVKATDGSRVSLIRFRREADGRLALEVAREPALELQETVRLLVRQMAALLVPPDGWEQDEYVQKYLAVEEMIPQTDPKALLTLLGWLEPVGAGGIPEPTIRLRIVEGLLERHARSRYTPKERMAAWMTMAALAVNPEKKDPNPIVRRAAVQMFGRLMPEGEETYKALTNVGDDWQRTRDDLFRSAEDTLVQVQRDDPDPIARDLADELIGVLGRQRRQGPGTPFIFKPGPAQGRTTNAGLEEMTVAEFLRDFGEDLTAAQRGWLPAGARAARVMPLDSPIEIYAQGPAMAAGLEERTRRAGLPEAAMRVVRLPLPAGVSYQELGVIVKDAALDEPVENPLELLVFTFWLSDLPRVQPAALIQAALKGLVDPSVKVLGVMIFPDAQGRAMLVVFA